MAHEDKAYFQLVIDREELNRFNASVSMEKMLTGNKTDMTKKLVEMIGEYNSKMLPKENDGNQNPEA